MGSSWHLRLSALLGVLLLTAATLAEDDDKDEKKPEFNVPRFIFPAAENLQFYSQDVVNISYYSDYKNPTLYFRCVIGDEGTKRLGMLENFPSGDGWNVVRMPAGVDSDNCWFNLKASDKEFNSVPFALSSVEPTEVSQGSEPIESSDTSQTTTASPTGTRDEAVRTGEPSPTTSIPPPPEGSSQTRPEEDKQANSDGQGMSMNVKIGIALGVALGVLGLVAMTAAVCTLRQRKRPHGKHLHDVQQRHEPRVIPHPSPQPHQVPAHLAEWYDGKRVPQKVERKPLPRFELP